MKKLLLSTAILSLSMSAFAQENTFKTLSCYKAVNPQDAIISSLDSPKTLKSETALEIKLKLSEDTMFKDHYYSVRAQTKAYVYESMAAKMDKKASKGRAQVDCDGGGWQYSIDQKTGNMILTNLSAVGELSKNGEGCGDALIVAKKPIMVKKVSCSK